MPEFEIQIKTTADLKAANDLKSALQDQIKAAKSLGQDASGLESRLQAVSGALNSTAANTVRLTAAKKSAANAARLLGKDSTALTQALSQIGATVPGFQQLSTIFTSLSGAATGGLVGVLGGIAAGLAGVGLALKEFAGAEEAVARLDAALAQTGQLTDSYRESLQSLASQLQETTAIADEEWLGVLRQLTQFGSTADTINADAEAVKNLAGIMGGDLQSAAMAVARAMQGNFTMFSRWGIQIDEHLPQVEKLQRLYQELAQRGGGQLEAMSRTLSGQFRSLRLALGDLLEVIGGGAKEAGFFTKILYGLTESAKWLTRILGGTIPQLEGLHNASKKTVTSLSGGSAAADKYSESLKSLTTQTNQILNAFDALKDRITGVARAQTELTDIDLAEKLADIDILEKSGRVSPAEATKLRSGARKKAAEEKFRIEDVTTTALIEIEQRKIGGAKAEVDAIEKQIKANEDLLKRTGPVEASKEKVAALIQTQQADRTRVAALRRQKTLTTEEILEVRGADEREIAIRNKILRAKDELNAVTAQQGFPRGGSEQILAEQDLLKTQLRGRQSELQKARESSEPEIERLERERTLRRNITPRQSAIEERRATSEAASQLQSEGKAGAEGMRTDARVAAGILRDINAAQKDAWGGLLPLMQEILQTTDQIKSHVFRLQGWHKGGRTP